MRKKILLLTCLACSAYLSAQTPVVVTQGGNQAAVTGSNALKTDASATTQPISAAALPLPSGAATAAKQPALGTAGTASADVITVQGIASMTAIKTDGSATTQPISGTVSATQSGTWTMQPGNTANTTPWLTTISQGGNAATVSAGGALKVDNSAVTQPVSGTVTATQATGTNLHMVCDSGCTPGGSFADNSAFTFGTSAINPAGYVLDDVAVNAATENSAAAPRMSSNRVPYGIIRDGALNERAAYVTAGNALQVDASATTQPVSASSLPLPTGASTAAKQPALGTAGTASADVITVQGIASMTALKVDGSAVTQPVSGTVTVTDGAGALNVIVDSSALPSGAATLGEQQTQTTVLQLLDDAVATTASAITTKGVAASGTDGTNARIIKTDTNGELQIDVLTMPTVTVTDGAGALNVIVDSGAITATLSAETTKVIGTVRTLGNSGATMDSVVGAGTAPTNQLVTGCLYNSTEISPTTGQAMAVQCDSKGRQRDVIMDGAGNTRAANVDANNNLGVVLPAETTKVLGTIRVQGNVGGAFDAATAATVPANAVYQGAVGKSAQPTAVADGQMVGLLASLDGAQYVRPYGPIIWSCGVTNIGTTLTQCQAAPGASLSLYVTDVVTQSNTATAGLFTLRFGTGTNCGTGTGNLLFGSASALMASPANTVAVNHFHLTTPIKLTANNALCVLGVVTNTTNAQITGFTAP